MGERLSVVCLPSDAIGCQRISVVGYVECLRDRREFWGQGLRIAARLWRRAGEWVVKKFEKPQKKYGPEMVQSRHLWRSGE